MMLKNRLEIKPLDGNTISKEYLTWMNDPEVLKFTESRWSIYNKNDLKQFVNNMNSSSNNYLFGIYVIETNKHIGNIKIGNIDSHHKFADLGIIIGVKEEWGKGYATESISLAIKYAFNDLKLHKLVAGSYANNFGSIKALKKVGFKECGTLRDHCVYDETRVDVITFEIINKG